MDQPTITFVLNGKTFSLRAGDTEAIGKIPAAERQQLLALLETVQQQEARAAAIARSAADKARVNTRDVPVPTTTADGATPSPERLGSGDVESLMARLVMEENLHRKPGPTKQGIFKWVLGTVAAIFLLVLIV